MRPAAWGGRATVAAVATFALIHGGGGSAWDWHLVAPALREHGHDAVAVDLPYEDESAGWEEYTDAVVRPIGDRRGVVVVGHSLGGFAAPLVCLRIPVDLLVLVAAMIPSPGEHFADWWANAGYEGTGCDDVFYHGVPPELVAEARRRERHDRSKALQEPWPLEAWPDTPTRYLLCRDDRMFPAGVGATPRPGAPLRRLRRDGRRPLHQPQPPARVCRPSRRLRRRDSLSRPRAPHEVGDSTYPERWCSRCEQIRGSDYDSRTTARSRTASGA